jgi:hypothetical protein
MLTRRSIFQILAAVCPGQVVTRRQAVSACATGSPRLCIADVPQAPAQPPEVVQRRLDLYRRLGIGTLRSHIRWSELEVANGRWKESGRLRYLRQVSDAGFKLKLLIQTLGGPPDWFFAEHPDARVLDRAGETTHNFISPWHPGLRDLLTEKTDAVFRAVAQMDLLAGLEALVVDLGPQGEAIFPAGWGMTATHTHPDPGYWFYEPHARADFTKKMEARYRTIETANALWGSRFSGFSDLQIPDEGSLGGPIWEDLLTWYRDSKRDLIVWQIDNYSVTLTRHSPSRRPPLLVLIPGIHITSAEWQNAVASGRGDKETHIMTDTEFLVATAAQRGCWLQYDAVGNAAEVSYIVDYLHTLGVETPLWGENAGGPSALNPEHLADVVIGNRLYGLDYVNAAAIFEPDTVTPNHLFPAFEATCQRLLRYFG